MLTRLTKAMASAKPTIRSVIDLVCSVARIAKKP